MGAIFWDPDYDYDKRYEVLVFVASDLYHWKNMDALYGEKAGNYIRARHTTTRVMPFRGVSDGVFLERGQFLLGHYVVTCENGREAKIPLYYGETIAGCRESFGAETIGGMSSDGTFQTSIDRLKGVCYQALPYIKDGKTWYDAILKVPDHCRGFPIKDVRFEQAADDCDVLIDAIEVF
jgi:hypothetical protein